MSAHDEDNLLRKVWDAALDDATAGYRITLDADAKVTDMQPVKVAQVLPFSSEYLAGPTADLQHSRARAAWWSLRDWWAEHRPHVHLGPCDHDGCL